MVLEIEARGHPRELDESGWFREFFADKMRRYYQDIENGQRPVVGVNIHKVPPETDLLLREISERKMRPVQERIDAVKDFKGHRDFARSKAALRKVMHSAKFGENLLPATIDAFAADATLGEIAGVIRMAYGGPYDVFGAWQSPI
jgi:methylmalonyl-CoA mutase N-terminal domain/subunit